MTPLGRAQLTAPVRTCPARGGSLGLAQYGWSRSRKDATLSHRPSCLQATASLRFEKGKEEGGWRGRRGGADYIPRLLPDPSSPSQTPVSVTGRLPAVWSLCLAPSTGSPGIACPGRACCLSKLPVQSEPTLKAEKVQALPGRSPQTRTQSLGTVSCGPGGGHRGIVARIIPITSGC